jgi:hypothetical protein
MLDELSKAAGTSPRIVLMSPNYHEDLGKPLPDPGEHNKNLEAYTRTIEKIAADRGCVFINLFELTERAATAPVAAPLTSNGIHLTPYGYWRMALGLMKFVDQRPNSFTIDCDTGTKYVNVDGSAVDTTGRLFSNYATFDAAKLKAIDGAFNFTGKRDFLPSCPISSETPKSVADRWNQFGHPLRITGLKPGNYELKADGVRIASASAEEWGKGVIIDRAGPEARQAEALRKAIIAKNFDFFNYQRPDNDAYILAFRKGEQGKNAVEIPKFLPLVAEKEKEIAELRVPKPVKYSLELVK